MNLWKLHGEAQNRICADLFCFPSKLFYFSGFLPPYDIIIFRLLTVGCGFKTRIWNFFFLFQLICIKSLINRAETVTDAVSVLFLNSFFLREHIEWEIIRKIFSRVFLGIAMFIRKEFYRTFSHLSHKMWFLFFLPLHFFFFFM